MDNTITFAVIVGFLLPPIIATINREAWSSQVKGAVAFVICLAAGAATAWYEATLDTHDLRKTIPLVFGAAIMSYHQFWKPTGIAPSIEKKTG